MRRGDKQQKLQIEKLTTDFKDALQRYSDMQKVNTYTRRLYRLIHILLLQKLIKYNCIYNSMKYLIYFYFDFKLITKYSLQSIAEKMKRHILVITNIENSMDGEDAEETQRLLQVQEQEHRATQRFKNFNIFALYTKQYDICNFYN